jgi:hypothetical protein
LDQVQIHVATWSIALLLFIVSFVLLKMGQMKGQKITHMILRVFYILVAGTGIGLVVSYNFIGDALIKGILALILLVLMEMILIKGRDRERTGLFWALFIIDLIFVFYYGYGVIS